MVFVTEVGIAGRDSKDDPYGPPSKLQVERPDNACFSVEPARGILDAPDEEPYSPKKLLIKGSIPPHFDGLGKQINHG